MAMWDKLFNKKKDEDPRRLNPIVQKSPMPAAPARVSTAKPVVKPSEPPPRKVEPPPPVQVERETKSRKKPEETKSRRPTDAETFLKRGLNRQAMREHDGAIED